MKEFLDIIDKCTISLFIDNDKLFPMLPFLNNANDFGHFC